MLYYLLMIFTFLISVSHAQYPNFKKDAKWFLPSNRWYELKKFQLKGEYFQVLTNYKGESGAFVFYDNENLKGKNFEHKINFLSGEIFTCKQDISRKNISPFFMCGNGFCSFSKSISEKKDFETFLGKPLVSGRYPCPIQFSPIYVNKKIDSIDYDGYLFEYEEIGKNFLKIRDTRDWFLDISFCKPGQCTKIVIDKSEFEFLWDKLQVVKNKRSHSGMNYLIENLLPCLHAKNIPCIKRHIASTEEYKKFYLSNSEYAISEVEIDEDLISELKQCLDYDNLLPHLLASRGVSKACVFIMTSGSPEGKGEYKFLPPVFPEGVQDRDEREILWNVEIK